MIFAANNDETFIRIKNNYSVPSSKCPPQSSILTENYLKKTRYWIFFTELVEIGSNVSEDV